MEISGIEKFSRYFALTALVTAAMVGGLIYMGILKMPGARTVTSPKLAVLSTPRPAHPTQPVSGSDDSKTSPSGSNDPAESGSFQGGLLEKSRP